MKYCIIGGNRFVGRYLAGELTSWGCETVVCDLLPRPNVMIPPECAYYQVDLYDKISLGRIFPILRGEDLAATNFSENQYHTRVPQNTREYFFSVNTVGTANLLETVYEKGCRYFLQFTTDMTYGKPRYLAEDTHHSQQPFDPYGASKKAAEEICREYRDNGMHITVIRPRMIMGPGRAEILLKLFRLIDWYLSVPTIGNGRNHYQMVSVFDFVSAAVTAVEKVFSDKEYNLDSEQSPDIRHLLRGVIWGEGARSFVLPTPGWFVKSVLGIFTSLGIPIMYKEQCMIADEEYVLDISDTVADLEWHPRYNDEDMLKEVYKMHKQIYI